MWTRWLIGQAAEVGAEIHPQLQFMIKQSSLNSPMRDSLNSGKLFLLLTMKEKVNNFIEKLQSNEPENMCHQFLNISYLSNSEYWPQIGQQNDSVWKSVWIEDVQGFLLNLKWSSKLGESS